MSLPIPFRRKTKKTQALDTLASVAGIWSRWQLAKTAGKGVRKGAKTAAGGAVVVKAAPWRRIALIGVAGGLAAAIAKRAKGGSSAPAYEYSPPTPAPTPNQAPSSAPATPATKPHGDPAEPILKETPPATGGDGTEAEAS
jgi:hypothetical protein